MQRENWISKAKRTLAGNEREEWGKVMRTSLLGMIRSYLVVVLISTIFLPGETRSQGQLISIYPITVGSRIRLLATTIAKRRIEGTIIEMDERSLLVGIEADSTLRVPRQAITNLDVSLGKQRKADMGFIIGGGIGVIMVAIIFSSYLRGSEAWFDFAAIGFVEVGLLGAGIGALIKIDRWSAVPIELVHVGLAPTQGRGMRLSLSLGF